MAQGFQTWVPRSGGPGLVECQLSFARISGSTLDRRNPARP